MIGRVLGLAGLVALGGCADVFDDTVRLTPDPDLAALCAADPVTFRQPLVARNLADDAIVERFGAVCGGLQRQDGFDFGDGLRVYACPMFLRRDKAAGAADAERIEKAFGRRIDIATIDSLASEPDNLRERDVARRAATEGRDRAAADLPLAVSAGFAGVALTALIVADNAGVPQRYVLTRGELDRRLRQVTTLAGAADILNLKNELGLLLRAPGADSGILSQCSATDVGRERSGWVFVDMQVRKNCEPQDIRTIRVDTGGAVTLLDRRKPLIESITCAD